MIILYMMVFSVVTPFLLLVASEIDDKIFDKKLAKVNQNK